MHKLKIYSISFFIVIFCCQTQEKSIRESYNFKTKNKMEIEIWSDVVCPFCYIGKTNLDAALSKFENKNDVQIIWKSFQLNPDIKTDATINLYQSLANSKGISTAQAKEMANYATEMAKEVGLTFNFEKAVVANSFKAHQLLHFAKKNGVQNPVKKSLLAAYFTEGKNIDDLKILVNIGVDAGLDKVEIESALLQNMFAKEVNDDIGEAAKLGISGVPFFVFNRRYTVSGAQPIDSFLQVLQKFYRETGVK